jgi:L-Ala-D/L-Glu epimerase
MRKLTAHAESWPVAGAFTIARGSRTEARVVVATIEDEGRIGRGECVPYARYGETVEGVVAAIAAVTPAISDGASRATLLSLMPAGAARNAIDCALWDLEAERSGLRAWTLAGLPEPRPLTTAYTLSLGTPESMEMAARQAAHCPLLKVKLGGEGDPDRIAAVRGAAPQSRLIVDANEAWDEGNLAANIAACHAAGVVLIEQPLPAGKDGILGELGAARRGIAFCADESLHTIADLPGITSLYQAINIKLDKAGGLTAALELFLRAKKLGLMVMAGCMVGTSLAMAPAVLIAAQADFADLDGPLLLARDREPGLVYKDTEIQPFGADLWG